MQSYFQKLTRGESLKDKPRSGRPPIRTSTLRRQLAQLLSQDPLASASVYASRLSHISGRRVSVRTIIRALHELGRTWRAPKRKRLTQRQRSERVAFARAHLRESWDGVWAYDECYFHLYRTSNRYWLKTSTDEMIQYPKLSRAQEKVSIGIGIAISRGNKSELILLSRGWTAPELKSKFDSTLLPSLNWTNRPGRQNRLLLDNDGRHHSPVFRQYMDEKGLRPIHPWPSNSPDLNPVENCFSWIKTYVERRFPSTEQELELAVRDAWRGYPTVFTERLLDSMPTRMQTVVKNNGGRIAY